MILIHMTSFNGLIYKLYQLKLPEKLVLIIRDYLCNCTFWYRVEGTLSSVRPKSFRALYSHRSCTHWTRTICRNPLSVKPFWVEELFISQQKECILFDFAIMFSPDKLRVKLMSFGDNGEFVSVVFEFIHYKKQQHQYKSFLFII